MKDDKLQIGLDYKITDTAMAKLDVLIGKSVKKTQVLERASKITNKSLNKMLDDYKGRSVKVESTTMKMVKSLGALAATSLSVGAAFGISKESIQMASDFTENTNKMKVVFGELYNEANAWSTQYADAMGMSQSKTREAMGDIQNLFVGFGMGREQAMGFGKDIISLANDLDSFNNLSAKGIDVQKNMVSALMGESEAAKAFGVSILEPQLAVASLALGLGKYSNKMDEATKIQIRLKAIQMQSADAMGDVARNLDTEVGKRRRLASEIENAKLNLGQGLMPVQMKALELGLKFIPMIQTTGDKFKQASTWVKENVTAIKAFGVAVGLLMIPVLAYKAIATTVWGIEKARALWTMAVGIPTTLKENLAIISKTSAYIGLKAATFGSLIATKAYTAAQWLLNAAFIASPIGWVVLAIGTLATAFTIAYKKIEPFKNLIDSIWAKLKDSAIGKLFSGKSTNATLTTNSNTTTNSMGSVSYGNMPKFRTGTDFVPNDMMAKLHYGERVLTKSENAQYTQGQTSNSPSINISINAVQELGNEIKAKIQPIVESTIANYQKKQLLKLGIGGA